MMKPQDQLINEAKAKHGEVFPCVGKNSLYECITHEEKLGMMMFWFNVAGDKSTRVMTLKINGAG